MNTMDISDTLHCSSGLLKILLQVMADCSEQLKFLIKLTNDVIAVVEVCRTMLIGKVCWYLTYCVMKIAYQKSTQKLCLCMRACVYACVCVHKFMCICMCVCMHMCVHVCMSVCLRVYAYAHVYMCVYY